MPQLAHRPERGDSIWPVLPACWTLDGKEHRAHDDTADRPSETKSRVPASEQLAHAAWADHTRHAKQGEDNTKHWHDNRHNLTFPSSSYFI